MNGRDLRKDGRFLILYHLQSWLNQFTICATNIEFAELRFKASAWPKLILGHISSFNSIFGYDAK